MIYLGPGRWTSQKKTKKKTVFSDNRLPPLTLVNMLHTHKSSLSMVLPPPQPPSSSLFSLPQRFSHLPSEVQYMKCRCPTKIPGFRQNKSTPCSTTLSPCLCSHTTQDILRSHLQVCHPFTWWREETCQTLFSSLSLWQGTGTW